METANIDLMEIIKKKKIKEVVEALLSGKVKVNISVRKLLDLLAKKQKHSRQRT